MSAPFGNRPIPSRISSGYCADTRINVDDSVNPLDLPDGVYPINISASGGGRTHTVQITLIIKDVTDIDGDFILDPFCGSGTTLVASKKLNRKCYGIEIDKKYCEIAKNRLLDFENEIL